MERNRVHALSDNGCESEVNTSSQGNQVCDYCQNNNLLMNVGL